MLLPSAPFCKSLNLQHWKAVLDPALALTPYGVRLAIGLSEVMELWVAREFWHILDNIHFYQQHPESLITHTFDPNSNHHQTRLQEMLQALREWEYIRTISKPTKPSLFWIGDKPNESLLPSNTDAGLIQDWELLAAALDDYIYQDVIAPPALIPVFRDAIALAVKLQSAFILTYQSSELGMVNADPPSICQVLQDWGISCQQISFDPIVTIEREKLLCLINTAGVSKFIWSGLHLAILHLIFPSNFMIGSEANLLTEDLPCTEDLKRLTGFWGQTQGFWYWL